MAKMIDAEKLKKWCEAKMKAHDAPCIGDFNSGGLIDTAKYDAYQLVLYEIDDLAVEVPDTYQEAIDDE